MPISGFVAAGADEALQQVLQRRLEEEQRRIQEQQRKDDLLLRQQEAAARERDRAEDRARYQRAEDIAAAGRTYATLRPGEITEEQAAGVEKDPALRGLIRREQRPIIDARPIAGTPPLDMSGPQSRRVVNLQPTGEQARQQQLEDDTTTYLNRLAQARKTNQPEEVLQSIASEALGRGIKVPDYLTGPTEAQKRATMTQAQIDAENRANRESDRRADRDENRIRTRPVRVAVEMSPGQQFKATRELRNDFVRETKAAAESVRQMNIMRESIAEMRKGGLAAGSQGVLVTFQKILDPNSVVRESEYDRTREGEALLTRMRGQMDQWIKGGAPIPLDQLESYVALAERYTQGALKTSRATKKQLDDIAEEWGLNKNLITRDLDADESGETTPMSNAELDAKIKKLLEGK